MSESNDIVGPDLTPKQLIKVPLMPSDPSLGFLLLAAAAGVFTNFHQWDPKSGDGTLFMLASLWVIDKARQYLQLTAPNFGGLFIAYVAGVYLNIYLTQSIDRSWVIGGLVIIGAALSIIAWFRPRDKVSMLT